MKWNQPAVPHRQAELYLNRAHLNGELPTMTLYNLYLVLRAIPISVDHLESAEASAGSRSLKPEIGDHSDYKNFHITTFRLVGCDLHGDAGFAMQRGTQQNGRTEKAQIKEAAEELIGQRLIHPYL